MEEWSRKLKLLHWMMIERADGVSPLICFDDDGGDGDGGGDGGDGGGDDDDAGGGGEGDFEGGEGEGDFEGGGDEGDVGDPEGGVSDDNASPEADYDFDAPDPGGGYADYGGAFDSGNLEQGLGGNAPDPNVPEPGQTVSDFLSSQQDFPTPDIQVSGLAAQPGREEQEGKERPDVPGSLGNIYDLPMGPPSTKELEREFQKEFQQQFEQPQPAPPQEKEFTTTLSASAVKDPFGNYEYGKDQSQVPSGPPPSTTVGLTPEQVAQSNQWDVGPTKEFNAFGVGPTANPFASTNVWDLPTPTQAAPPKEEQNPWDQQQTAINTFGFNPTTPTGYNMPSAISGVPTGAPPPDQQVATGQPNAVQTTGFIAPSPTAPVTSGPLGPATPTGKSDFISSRDPFAPQQPDIWDPNTFAPPVGMVMANVATPPAPSAWDPQTASPFGPQAPTQASPQVAQAPQGQAPPYDPTIFDPASMQSQAPPSLWDIAPTQQQTPPAVASREERERERPENREPVVVSQAPAPSQIIDTGAKYDRPELSTVPAPTVSAPPVEVAAPAPPVGPPAGTVNVATQDANANTAFAPGSPPSAVVAGNPLAGGIPTGPTVELPSPQQDFFGGGPPLTQ